MVCRRHATVWLLRCILLIFVVWSPAVDAIQAIKCSEWYLRAPKGGTLECSHSGEEALHGTVCLLTCDTNLAPSDDEITCQADGSWYPTKSPTCDPDGSVTVIVVPAVVGTIVVLFIVGFVYAQMSKRCQTKKRTHEEVDVEGGGGGVIRPGKEFAEAHRTSGESFAPENLPVKEVKKKKRKPIKSPKSSKRIGGRMARKFRITAPAGLLRRRMRGLRSGWKSSGPKRVVGLPHGVGESSVCGDVDWQERLSGSSAPESSSSEEESSSSSSEEEVEENTVPAEIETVAVPEEPRKPSSSKSKKIAPPRPPAPRVKPSRSSDPHHRRSRPKKNASSGYSSDDANHKKKKHGKSSSRRPPDHKKKKSSSSKTNVVNPYDNYPVAGSDRQYLDFEHDYRKNEHFYEAGAYHPQYHPVKSFPIKPAHKKKEKSEKERKKSKERSRKKSKDGADDAKDTAATGGVKYYSIKQDEDEIRRNKKRSKSRRKRSKERREEEKEKKRRKDHKERDRTRRRRAESERRKRRHESSHRRKDSRDRKERERDEKDSHRRKKKTSRPKKSSERHRSSRKVVTSDEG